MLFTNERRGCFAKDPAVILFEKDYFLYYTICCQIDPFRIGIAKSRDLENWQDMGEFPLTQECEQNGVGAPAAIVLNDRVHFFTRPMGMESAMPSVTPFQRTVCTLKRMRATLYSVRAATGAVEEPLMRMYALLKISCFCILPRAIMR